MGNPVNLRNHENLKKQFEIMEVEPTLCPERQFRMHAWNQLAPWRSLNLSLTNALRVARRMQKWFGGWHLMFFGNLSPLKPDSA